MLGSASIWGWERERGETPSEHLGKEPHDKQLKTFVLNSFSKVAEYLLKVKINITKCTEKIFVHKSNNNTQKRKITGN